MAAQVSRQIGLLRSARVTKTATKSQETQAGLTRLAAQNRKWDVPVGMLIWKVGLQKIRPTRKAGLQKIQLTQKAGFQKIQLT
jgi:hypothetical protein